ncbi:MULTISPECIES: hypothetical protein [Leuconostoc]|uniref:Uncharacterized protein n=2 Tax=Leuconostoc TaxID=1243 RepID=A0AAN2QWL6_9LACO|nr:MULTISPECIES: hypothetical protein [Leuconostoc]API72097.1 hypothetical protein A6B45_05165 [Leuconostoc suionicum]MBE4726690.1 hypothetical protein [Leuconostoc citreum]MBS0941827.1 hypothetical protein [Leuconostoc mesenteroides]MBU7546848.1 hypothetical protein [Leuconostoc mesenteroides]MBZ5952312.1 hypothetical protein [Leuconostoc gasicomitatum]
MKLPHPLKKARDNREKMKQEAQQIVENYDKGQKPQPVDNKIIWYVIGGFVFVFILKGLSLLIGG